MSRLDIDKKTPGRPKKMDDAVLRQFRVPESLWNEFQELYKGSASEILREHIEICVKLAKIQKDKIA